jgi:ABC-2 type transport system ATP-binding protein
VLLSSHLLHEIEVVADDLVVIGRGRIVAAGTKADLLAGAGTEVLTRHHDQLTQALTAVGLDYSDVPTPAEAMRRNTAEPSPHRAQPRRLRVDADTEAVGRVAHEAGVALIELRGADGAGLEEMFLELTADTQRDSHDASTTGVPSYQEGAVA